MKPKSILLWLATFAFTFGIISCGKDDVTEKLPVPDGQDTTTVIPPKQDTIYYVIDTTKKITINEILYLEDYNMAAVSGIWNKVAYGNGRWVAVGDSGQIATSTDGKNWSTQTVGNGHWKNVARSAGGIWVAVSAGGVIGTSINGTSWSTQTTITNNWWGIASGNGKWIAVGSNSYMAISSTSGWTTKQVGTVNTTQWNDIAYYNGTWVAVGSTGYITTSTDDGTTWSTKQTTLNTEINWKGVAYGTGIVSGNYGWVIVGTDNTKGYMNVSQDATSLSNGYSVSVADIRYFDVAYDNIRRVIACSNGTIDIDQGYSGFNPKIGSSDWFGVAIKTD